MIVYITGVPGHGKSLRAMWYLQQPEYKDRPVFSNIEADTKTGLPDGHSPLPDDWRDVPQGSVIVVDECQHLWPQRGPSKPVPDQISALDTHRHLGIDFILMTQRPTGVDHHVRGLVGKHEHLRRKAGAEASVIHRKDEAFDPKDKQELREADSELWRFPKDLYGKYKSSVEHTGAYRFKLPNKAKFFLVIIAGLTAGVVFMFWRVAGNVSEITSDKPPVEQGASSESQSKIFPQRSGGGGPSAGDCPMTGKPTLACSPGYRPVDWHSDPDPGAPIKGCFHQGDTCICWRGNSGRPERNYSVCRNWLASN